jgi:two-component sensor histidine kinase
MALAHETLYQSETLSKIEFNKYINELIKLLSSSFGRKTVNFKVDCENISLDIVTAVPLGLIINELMSNSLKYAFPDYKEDSQVTMSLREINGKKELIIEDNGIGFPKELDFSDTDSLGLQLVNSLVSQINGNIILDKKHKGSKFIITF